MIKKADIVLLIALVVLGGIITYLSLTGNTGGDTVLVSVNGEVYGEYDLNEDQEIDIAQNGHTNHITIKDGYVQMATSSCRNQLCVDEGKICNTKDKIVCLPNKVVIEIVNKTGGEYDVISG